MDGEAHDPVNERLARLEAEVGALRAEVAGLKTAGPLSVRQSAPSPAVWPPVFVTPIAPPNAAPPPSSFASLQSAAKKGTSLESEIGSRVLSKVAVVLLLIGAALFLKWAFDNRWIGPGGRVAVGLVAGAAIVVWSERFRRQHMAAFSYALKAVGSGVLYLSLWASFQLYHLVPGWLAFTAMVAVTAWNVVMAWSQDSQLLAGYALLGAYLTPVLLGSGGDHEVFLFSYLLVIAVGVLALLRSKPWVLLLGALPVTAGFFVAWYAKYFAPDKAGKTAVFALLLWAVFAAVPLLAREGESVIAGVLAPLGAGMFGALSIYFVLADSSEKAWEPWAAVAFAAVYLALARVRVRSVVLAVHLSLGVVFLTVAIPLKANGRGILLGWTLEAVALLAVSTLESVDRRAKMVLRVLGCAALLLGVVGALVQPMWLGNGSQAFWNRGFGMEIGAGLALAAAIALSRRMRDAVGQPEAEWLAVSAFVLLNVVLVVAMQREIANFFEREQSTLEGWGQGHALADFVFSGWLMLLGAVDLALGFWKRVALARWIGLVLLAVTVVKAFAYDMRGLSSGYRVVSYLALGVLLMAVSLAYQRDWLGLRELASVQANGADSEVHG